MTENKGLIQSIEDANKELQKRLIMANKLIIQLFKLPVTFTGEIKADESGFPLVFVFCEGAPLVNPHNLAQCARFVQEFGNFITGMKTILNIKTDQNAVNN